MAADARKYASEVLAGLCAKRGFRKGQLGIFVENVPPLDPDTFVSEFARLAPSPARLALLGLKKRPKGAGKIRITVDAAEANVWRNDAEARRGVPGVFVVLGPSPKLNSLRTAVPILTAADVREAAVEQCLRLHNDRERQAFLRAVQTLTGEISTDSLMRYGATMTAGATKGKAALMDIEPKEVGILGLLPSPRLMSAASTGAARKVIRRNLEYVKRLQQLPRKVHALLASLIERKHNFALRAQGILKFSRSGELQDLNGLSLEEIEEVLKADLEDKGDKGERADRGSRRERIEGDALVLDLVLNDDSRGVKVASQRFEHAIEPDSDEEGFGAEEFTVGRRTVLPRVRVGSTQANDLFGKLLTVDVWGGVISTPERTDFIGAQKLLSSGDADVEEFRPDEEIHVRGILKKAVERSIVPPEILSNWDKYAKARSTLLGSHWQRLIDHPLLALKGDEQFARRAKDVVNAYAVALEGVKFASKALIEHKAQDAGKRLAARVLTLDIAFIRVGEEITAVAAPTHPFHLWRWLGLAELISNHRDELRSVGDDVLLPLVADPPPASPQIVLSPFAVKQLLDRSRPLVSVGTFASLPFFTEPASRQSGKFRVRSFMKIAERLIRLMPHAALGVRIALVDPPTVSGAIEDLLDLVSPFDDETFVPLHVRVLRTRRAPEAADEEEEELFDLIRELTEREGTLVIVPTASVGTGSLADVGEFLAKEPVHIAVIFDPGSGERIAIAPATRPTLSPLVIPRAYKYDAFDDRLDLVIAGDAEPFSTYNDLFCETLSIPREDFVGRRSGALQNRRQLEAIARSTIWMVIVDQAIEPTLHIKGADRIDWRTDGGRDIVTFTAHPDSIESLIADALRVAGLVPDEETRKRTLTELFSLSGEAVLALTRAQPGLALAEPRVAKGTIGVLTAVRWYMKRHPDSLVISLDDHTSRQWVLGVGSDDRHGDLLVVRQEPDGVLVEALEVKTHEDGTMGVRERGNRIEGRAVAQIDQTILALNQILAVKPASPILQARQDILRDQLYRAVASRSYEADQRARHVRLLEDLFSLGPKRIDGVIFKISIVADGEPIDPVAPTYKNSEVGHKIGVVELTESGASGKFRSGARGETRKDNGRREAAKVVERTEGVDDAVALSPESAVSYDMRRDEGSNYGVREERPNEPVRIHIGETLAGTDVAWAPSFQKTPLNNFGFLVTGDSGTGKTQIIRALVAGVCDRGLPVCIFDFKNDYAETSFAHKHGLRVHDVNRHGLPFNPLSLLGDASGEVQPIRQVHELAGILQRIYKLSAARQAAQLRAAISAAYERHGIRVDAWQNVRDIGSVPDFNEVKAIIEADDRNDGLLDRLSPLFDLNLFPRTEAKAASFDKLMGELVVLDLHKLPNDMVKSALSEFMIVRLHGHILKGEQPRELRRLLVFDEAWRVSGSERLQELAREGRAFGVGIVIGTQFPGDIPEELAGNLATQLMLSNQSVEHRRSVLLKLVGSTSGPDAKGLQRQLAHLQMHQGYFRNQQYTPYVLVTTKPYYMR
jgi:hypothetical protein